MRLFHELRDRNVFRVGAAYAIVAWIAMQAGDILLGNFGAPEWVFRALVVLLALGFPVALLLAWAFELTPEGIRRNAEVDRAGSLEAGARRPVDYAIVAGLVVVIGLMAMDRFGAWGAGPLDSDRPFIADAGPAEAGVPHGDRRAIAVLPFDNFSPDPNDAYFAAGITEELTSQLSRIGALRVMSRLAVTRALEADAPLTAVASALGVGTFLEGSVRKDRDRVRITAQIVDPVTGAHLWSDAFDRHLSDIFQIQRDVAMAIVDALRAELTPGEEARIAAVPTADLEAYELYLRSREHTGTDPVTNRRGIDLLWRAVERDPGFAEAWNTLSYRYFWASTHGHESAADSALALARHALDLEPSLSSAHGTLAMAHLAAERVGEAESAFARAIRLDPNHEGSLMDGAVVASMRGDLAEAIRRVSAALLLSPNLANTRFHVAMNLLLLGDVARARAWLALAAAEGMELSRLDLARLLLLTMDGPRDAALAQARHGLDRWAGIHEFESLTAAVLVFLESYGDPRDVIADRARDMPDVVTWHPIYRTWRTLYAFLLQQSGEGDRAAALLEESFASTRAKLDAGSDHPGRALEMATIRALQGETEDALEWLDRAYARGYRMHRFLDRDPMFAALQGHPRFESILLRMEEARGRERARVDREGIAAAVDSMIAEGARPRP
jgi:TolB-like protein